MSFYFLVNNFHFALELMGAVVFLMAAWLSFDTYSLRKEFSQLAQALGLALIAVFETIAGLNTGNDLLSYAGMFVLGIGALLVISSFLKQQQLQMQSVLVIPSYANWSAYADAGFAILFGAIALLSLRRMRGEFNKTWLPFSTAFALLAIAWLAALAAKGSETSVVALTGYVFEFAGFVSLARWVWQFLQLRIRESIVLIFISAALFLSTVVTLAFSTILINQITTQTQTSLITDARVLSLDIDSLKDQSLVKAERIALDSDLKNAIVHEDFAAMEQEVEAYMETYNLGFLTVTDANGSVLVRAHALSRRGDSLLGERALEEALKGNPFVTVETSPVEKLSIRAAAPVSDGKKTVGAIIAGYPLDNALVDNIKRVTGLEMFVYDRTTAVAATALAADGRTRATGIELHDTIIQSDVLGRGVPATADANLYGRAFMMGYLPLINGDDKIVGMIAAGKSQQDILDIANETNRLTLMTVIIIMLLLAYPIYAFTKRLNDGV